MHILSGFSPLGGSTIAADQEGSHAINVPRVLLLSPLIETCEVLQPLHNKTAKTIKPDIHFTIAP